MARTKSRRTIATLARHGLVSGFVAAVAKSLGFSLRYEREGAQELGDFLRESRGAVFVIWHREILLAIGHPFPPSMKVLVSSGRDGEAATRILAKFGMKTVRGSSSRGGDRALLEMLTSSEQDAGRSSFIIAPDGPRGPSGIAKIGAVYLASRTGMPLVPVRFATRRSWQLRTWDRMLIPKPFARVRMRLGEQIRVPPDVRRDDLEPWLAQLQAAMAAAAPAEEPGARRATADGGDAASMTP